MRFPKFKVKRFEKNGYVFYGIHVPAYLNPSGKAGYHYWPTKAEAERGRQELQAAVSTESKVQVLSNAQVVDAQRALELLAEAGLDGAVSLVQAVEAALPVLQAGGRGLKVEQLCEEFAAAKAAGWSAVSRRNFATVAKLFLAEFAGKELREVSGRVLEGWLSARFDSAGYKAFVIRTLRPAFSYAVRQEYLRENPFERVERVRTRTQDEVDVYTPDEVRRVLQAAPTDCVGAFALLLFAGIRPTELTRLRWGDVRDGFVYIRPSVAKRQQVRIVEVLPTLEAWLALEGVRGEAGQLVCPANWTRKRRDVLKAAGVQRANDAARHSFASYHLALYKDEGALKAAMGHSRGSDTLFVHYRAAVTPADAERFWQILPVK